jgi:hypothetical protein
VYVNVMMYVVSSRSVSPGGSSLCSQITMAESPNPLKSASVALVT